MKTKEARELRRSALGPVRVVLVALILAASSLASWYFWPRDEHVSIGGVTDQVYVIAGGPDADVFSVDFERGPHGSTFLDVEAENATNLGVQFLDGAFGCEVQVGTCRDVHQGIWEADGVPIHLPGLESFNALEVRLKIPPGHGTGVVTSRGFISVAVPEIVVFGPGRPLGNYSDYATVRVDVPDGFESTVWNAGQVPSTSGSGPQWTLPIGRGGTSPPISASGVLPDQQDIDERDLLLTGIFLSAAAAALLALVAEIRRREPGGTPQSVTLLLVRTKRQRPRVAGNRGRSTLRSRGEKK